MAEDVAQPWLALHCQTLPGASQGLVVQGDANRGAPKPLAHWPKTEPEASDLAGVAREALDAGRPVLRTNAQPIGSTRCWSDVSVPFGPGSRFGGAVALRIEHPADRADLAGQEAVARLQAGASWLEGMVRGASTQHRLVTALELVATALEHERLDAAATAVATDLAAHLDCQRASIGLSQRGQMRVEALSNAATFDPRSSLIQGIEAAMDEAADQDAPVCHPPPGNGPPRVAMAHQALARSYGAGAVWTVPLGSAGRVTGAMTFERSEAEAPSSATIELCEDFGALLGPLLDTKRRARDSWLEEAREIFQRHLQRLRGPGHAEFKATAIGCLGALMLLLFMNCGYRITAEATLEGRVQRAIVAGVDGFISEANVRAGDLLVAGQSLGRLDDRDLLLEHRNWTGKRDQLAKEHRKALALHDRSQVSFLSAKLDQANAELALVAAQLERTHLVAPFDGIVVKGDLSQSLGSPVERGDLLFEIAPLDGYRIILEVDQSDIAEPHPGQRGRLALTALPGQKLPLTVTRITPVSIAEDGRNYFRVEAHLDQPVEGLRPGMEGVAKIEVGERRLAWIWTHGLTDWLRLRTWTWLP